MEISETVKTQTIIDESGTVWEVTSAWCAVCGGEVAALKRKYNRPGYSPDLVVYRCDDCRSERYEVGAEGKKPL